MLDRLGFSRHVTEADLTAVWTDARLGESSKTAAAAHVRECAACRGRFASLSTWLDGLRTDARQQADEAFPPERLAAQQAHILRRLEAMERPAKVLAFPRFTRPIAAHHTGRQQWIAAAAAAGLVVGMGLGQIFDIRGLTTPDGPAARPEQISRIAVPPERAGMQTISNLSSDEDFLYDSGLATTRVPESLRSLHEITPSAREFDPR